jgi:hypothetical protein
MFSFTIRCDFFRAVAEKRGKSIEDVEKVLRKPGNVIENENGWRSFMEIIEAIMIITRR